MIEQRCSLDTPQPPYLALAIFLIGLVLACMLPGCSSTPKVPPQAPPAVEVKVPVPVACEIEQVPVPTYPAASARKGMGIWDLSRIIAADRRTRMAENERLRAANNNPCPGATK